jgi:glutathione-specific gamma-glutamylcyclotransferase
MSKIMHLTEDLVRTTQREVADTGPPTSSTVFSEADYDEHLAEFLAERPDGPLYVFCYGSLIWKPVFEPAATAHAIALGWQRAFCLKLVRFRGTREQPGLMMQIDRGGRCEGVVQQVALSRELADLSALWRREMTIKPPGNLPQWIDVELSGVIRKAIAFTANPASPNYVGGLTPAEVAQTLSTACGHWGSGADYLRQTVLSLDAAGIHDRYLWNLQERVAELIEARMVSRANKPKTELGGA